MGEKVFMHVMIYESILKKFGLKKVAENKFK